LSAVKRVVRKSGLVYLGYGQDCVVTKSTLLPETVVAINGHELTCREAKNIYYTHKLLKTIFPHNFPAIRAVFGKHPDGIERGLTFSYREEKNGKKLDRDSYSRLDKMAVYPFRRVADFLVDLAVPIDEIDNFRNNFVLCNDGGVYFLDTLMIYGGDPKLEVSGRITDHMRSQKYSQQEIKVAKDCLARIRFINSQTGGL